MGTRTIKGLPVYRAELLGESDGMLRVSLVSAPAVESDFRAYGEQETVRTYSVKDEAARRVFGVVLRADYPIYRVSPEWGEYYITFGADAIRAFAQKYLAEGRQNRVDLAHDMWEIRGAEMVQYFIKDTAQGISPKGYEDIADGSLFAEYQITDDGLWSRIVSGEFRGFSVEIVHAEVPEEMSKQTRNDMKLGQFIKAAIAQGVKAVFSSVNTDKGVIFWGTDTDLKEGDDVWTLDEDGNTVELADGDYATEDGKVITIASGKVTGIADKEAEVAPEAEAEETAETEAAEEENPIVAEEDAPMTDAEKDAYIKELEATVEGLQAEVADKDARIEELEAKLSEPAAEQHKAFKHSAVEGSEHKETYLERILAAGRN